MAKTQPVAKSTTPDEQDKRKARLLQEDVPSYSLDQALRVPRAIADNYAFKPTKPVNVAGAMGMTHTSGPFRAISGASVAYGLTAGAAKAPEIGITPLGMRILRPKVVGDDDAAKREALLKPKVIGQFLRQYDGAALPPEGIAKNVLEGMGVPIERLNDVLELILTGAKAVGFIREWPNGRRTVDLAAPSVTAQPVDGEADAELPAVATSKGSSHASTVPVSMSVGPGIHINIEIHIAADAQSETIEDIFKNMRRYILTGDVSDNGTPTE